MQRGTPLRIASPLTGVIRHLHPQIKRKLRAALEAIALDSRSGKPLKEDLEGLRSFRMGRFRIIYRTHADGPIEILAFGPRDRIYEETRRLVQRSKK